MSTSKFFTAITGFALVALLIPGVTFASTSSKPTCTLVAETSSDRVSTSKEDTNADKSGDVVTLSWSSRNATSATDADGNSIGLTGTATTSPTETTDYGYTFKTGSRKVTCSIELSVVSGSIDAPSLITQSKKPSLTGTATGSKKVTVVVTKTDGSSDTVFQKKSIKVSRGAWKASVSKSLADGVYQVQVFGDTGSTALATGSLYVGNVAIGSLSVSSIPLLAGGMAAPGSTVPISYLNVVNTGKTPVSITGFRVQQTGGTPAGAVSGFSSVDGTGTSRAATDGIVTFTNGVGDVPSTAVIAPGERKLFTLKATVSPTAAIGTQLKLNVVGLDAVVGSLKAAFPILGTTWTVGY